MRKKVCRIYSSLDSFLNSIQDKLKVKCFETIGEKYRVEKIIKKNYQGRNQIRITQNVIRRLME